MFDDRNAPQQHASENDEGEEPNDASELEHQREPLLRFGQAHSVGAPEGRRSLPVGPNSLIRTSVLARLGHAPFHLLVPPRGTPTLQEGTVSTEGDSQTT